MCLHYLKWVSTVARPDDEKTVTQHRGGKIISCRKHVETPNISPTITLKARRENRTGRSSKRETEENVLLENRELSCQSPQWAAWDDSQGLTHTPVLRLVQNNKSSTGNS